MKTLHLILTGFILLVLITSGCTETQETGNYIQLIETLAAPPEARKEVPELDVVYKTDNTPEPSWVMKGNMNHPPWEGTVYMARSGDGLAFTGEKLFIDRAGVPNIMLTDDNKLVAIFQYFSFKEEEMFDVIAYTVSGDAGNTWSPVRKITIQGKGFEKIGAGGPNPVDPTLVQLDDGSFRLYFTFHKRGEQFPGLFSAHSDSLERPFQSEGPQLEANRMILDPAVVKYNGKWHHYTVLHGEKIGAKKVNVHSVSGNGQDFVLDEDIPFNFQFLGDVIEDDGKLRFYGTGNGVESATSTDGYSWTMDTGQRANGADPGVVKLPDSSYLILYTRGD